MTTDGSGNLYVANTASYDVEVFAPPYRDKPRHVKRTSPDFPIDIAVARSGIVAILTVCGGTGYNCYRPGRVYFYANDRASSPCAMVSGDSKISRILWGAFDVSGTLYIAGENAYKTTRIAAISGGCSATSLTILNPGNSVGFPEGVQVDKSGHIAVGESHGFGNAPWIDVYEPPKEGSHRLTLISQVPLSDSGVVSSFAFTKDGTRLYTAEPHYSLEYAYPGGGYSIGQLVPPGSGDLIEGVAVTPAERP